MTGIVLAGGKSSRLKRNKALENVGGRTLLRRAVDALSQVSDEILVVTAKGQFAERIPPHPLVRMIEDIQPERGPAAGLYAGLLVSRSDHAWAVSCDLPFLNPGLLRHLMTLAPGYDAVIPMTEDDSPKDMKGPKIPQPLHAIYSKRCIPALEKLLQGTGALRDLSKSVNSLFVEETEMEAVDPGLRSFFNVNSEEDLALARSMAQQVDA